MAEDEDTDMEYTDPIKTEYGQQIQYNTIAKNRQISLRVGMMRLWSGDLYLA